MLSISKARIIDRKIGKPICAVLSFIKKYFFPVKRFNKEKVKKILIIKMWGMGTILYASPAIRNFKNNFKDAKIYFLTLKANKGIYDDNDFIDEIKYFSLTNMVSVISQTIELFLWFWKEKFDLVLDMEFVSRFTAIISFFSFARYIAGYSPKDEHKNLYDIIIPYEDNLHILKIFLKSCEIFHLENISETIEQPIIKENDKIKIDNFLNKEKIKNFIIVNPNTSDLAYERMWPIENYSKLIDFIIEKYNLYVFLAGAENDINRVTQCYNLVKKKNKLINFAGKTTKKELAYLMSKSLVCISNDSGPLHLAEAMGTKTISFFGPETPVLYGPIGENHTVLYLGIECSPCISIYNEKEIKCNYNAKCIKNINLETAMQAVKKILENKNLL